MQTLIVRIPDDLVKEVDAKAKCTNNKQESLQNPRQYVDFVLAIWK